MKKTLKAITKSLLSQKINYHLSSSWHAKKNNALILNLHRIDNLNTSLWSACPPLVFREFLLEISKFFSIVSLSQIQALTSKPKLVLSFDDGYLDFQTIALPILDELNLTCNHNIIPGCAINGIPPLNVLIQDFVGAASLEEIRKIDWDLEFPENLDPRKVLANLATQLKNSKPAEQINYANFIIPQLNMYQNVAQENMMSLQQIKQLPEFVEIGNHSMNHFNATKMEFRAWKADLEESQEWLDKNFNLKEKIYAFPNGDFGREHLNELELKKYDHILLVDNSSSRVNSKNKKRVNFSPQHLAEARFDLIRPLLGV